MDIASKIINSMPLNLNELERARYLYLELCKIVSFSTQYQNTDLKTMADIHNKKVDITNINDNEVNCRIWSQLYSQLLDMVGIKNCIIDEGHQYVEFFIDDKKWIADATYGSYTDLSRVQNDDETIGFGLSFFQDRNKHNRVVVINDEVNYIVNKIDQKLGYNTDKKQNLLEFKKYLNDIKNGNIDIRSFAHNNEITKENEVCFKLEYLFSTVGKLNSGYYEKKDFIYHLESILLTEEELKTVGAVELKKTNPDKSVDIIQCIYANHGEEINYYLLMPNREIQKYKAEQIIKLSMMGYGIEDKQIPGIIYPKRFRKGVTSNDYKYKFHKILSNMNLMKMDPIFDELEENYKTK